VAEDAEGGIDLHLRQRAGDATGFQSAAGRGDECGDGALAAVGHGAGVDLDVGLNASEAQRHRSADVRGCE
jgi:hypothetical protein